VFWLVILPSSLYFTLFFLFFCLPQLLPSSLIFTNGLKHIFCTISSLCCLAPSTTARKKNNNKTYFCAHIPMSLFREGERERIKAKKNGFIDIFQSWIIVFRSWQMYTAFIFQLLLLCYWGFAASFFFCLKLWDKVIGKSFLRAVNNRHTEVCSMWAFRKGIQ
jgi:hypothetical protein